MLQSRYICEIYTAKQVESCIGIIILFMTTCSLIYIWFKFLKELLNKNLGPSVHCLLSYCLSLVMICGKTAAWIAILLYIYFTAVVERN